MWMTKRDIADYPELFTYLVRLQIVLTLPKLMKNLRHWGSYDDAANPKSRKLEPTILYGTNPLVKVTRLAGWLCATEYALGCARGSKPWEIGLDTDMVKSFNKNTKDPANWDTTAKGNSVPIIGVTILHELCHWGRLQAETARELIAAGIEAGEEFEIATYGKVVAGRRFF